MNIKLIYDTFLNNIDSISKDNRVANKYVIAKTLTYLHFTHPDLSVQDPNYYTPVVKHFEDQLFCTFRKVLEYLNIQLDMDELISGITKNPILKSALQLYIATGAFSWVDSSASRFKLLVQSNKIDEEAGINCTDAIFYGLLKGNYLPKNIVARLSTWTVSTLKIALGFKKSTPIDFDWCFKTIKTPYLIIADKVGKHNNGIYHTMVSFPYSSDSLLKTLITKQPVQNDESIVFTLWVNLSRSDIGLGRLGELPLSELPDYAKNLKLSVIPLDNMKTNLYDHIVEADKLESLFNKITSQL